MKTFRVRNRSSRLIAYVEYEGLKGKPITLELAPGDDAMIQAARIVDSDRCVSVANVV